MTDKSIDYEYLEEEYYWYGRFPIWLEYHVGLVLVKLDEEEWAKENELHDADNPAEKAILKQQLEYIRTTKREQVIERELEKLDRFYEIMADSDKGNREVEKEVYGEEVGNFYLLCSKLKKKLFSEMNWREQRRIEESNKHQDQSDDEETEENEDVSDEDAEETEEATDPEEKTEQPKAPESTQVIEKIDNENLRLEKGLSADKREELFAKGFRRLKISPFGKSGAAYYWVNPRYNESKEHAFFCYLIEAELKRYFGKIETNETHGPDIEFEHKGKRYCFDVETGKNLTRHPDELEAKFSRYKSEYDVSFIFITDRKFKYKYSKFGTVVTRSTVKEIIAKLFV
jgi:hypothetical protein